ncbi:SDR family NAD(P)-dependent oxidoreductase [Paenibacillus sp. J5C_2022]|uniref:SDR family NAD(P)-dependent oxidoreductase n=1 Tax=Paenibacillus sp. J5C2022 TaxID=2977129 RepID=UPI0021D12599|nr:SDR family NAD(P)-dependent oxidoreductase [Paenibacillus sp. J5C2022]MCU6709983.1 SDR family NAD(P)-dependent oxidoreductase [Paenibacillus sp. J5C2022]
MLTTFTKSANSLTFKKSNSKLEALQGKTILITGASSGIGEALAYQLAHHDVHLILVARREDRLTEMKREIESLSATVSVCRADLREQDEMDDLLIHLSRQQGGVDIFVSNAGHSIRRKLMDSLDRYHDFTRTMAINYFAPVRLTLALIPQLRHNRGHVINVSTINASLIPFPYWAAYQASKSAFDTWFRSAAPEMNAAGIATTSFYFPLVRTPMIEPTAAYRRMPAMSPERAARLIVNAMLTKRRTYRPWWLVFGELASVLGRQLWERIAPRFMD